jgi:hypothetical protein
MDWLNIHTSTIDSVAFKGCDPIERATWLCLLRYCMGQENGGRIDDCATWGDSKWQQLCGVKRREVQRNCALWTHDGNGLTVAFYPSEKEREVSAKRVGGRNGGAARTEVKAQAARANGTKGGPKQEPKLPPKLDPSSNPTEGKGTEGNGREGGTEAAEDRDDLFGGASTPREPTTDREIANALSGVVQWYAGDPDKATANLAQIGNAVRDHGRPAVHAAGRAVTHRLGRLAWPNEILAELLSEQGAAAPTPRADEAKRLVGKHGWQACAAAAGIPEAAIGRESTMIEAMVAQGEVFDAVAKLGPA